MPGVTTMRCITPYVIGVKPFSRRFNLDEFDETTRQALAWFQSQVPERTLYNWQNRGAELIAQFLREQSEIELLAGD